MQQECGDSEEYRRHDDAQRLLLGEFVLQEAVRGKLAAIVGADPAEWRQEAVNLLDDRSLGRSGRQGHDEIVEGALHVERASDRVLARPEDDEIAIVRKRQGRSRREHEFRRQRDADDAEGLESPIENDIDGVARTHHARMGIGGIDDDLLGARRIDPATLDQIEAVEQRLVGRRNRDDATRDGKFRNPPV